MTDIKVVEWNKEWPRDLDSHVFHMHGTEMFLTTVPAIGGDIKAIIFPITDGENVIVTKKESFSSSHYIRRPAADAIADSLAHHFDEGLVCDVCGAPCDDPWHFSVPGNRHMHACDACWDVDNMAPYPNTES